MEEPPLRRKFGKTAALVYLTAMSGQEGLADQERFTSDLDYDAAGYAANENDTASRNARSSRMVSHGIPQCNSFSLHEV